MFSLRASELQEIFGSDEFCDLNTGAVMVHNAHLKARASAEVEQSDEEANGEGDGHFFASYMENLAPEPEKVEPREVPEREVDQSPGADEEGRAAFTYLDEIGRK